MLEHELVPEHVISQKDEVNHILDMYNINKEQLPKIKSSDAVIKEIGAKEGDVVKVKRKSKTAGIFFAYRLVVEQE